MPTLTLYLTDHGRVGHAYVGLTDDNGKTEYYGYYPKAAFENEQSLTNFFERVNGPGELRDDQKTFEDYPSTPSAHLELTREQFQNVQDLVQSIKNDPGHYVVGSANCVDFANDVLRAAEPGFDIGDFFTAKELSDNNLAGLYVSAKYGEHHLVEPSGDTNDGNRLPGKADWAIGIDMTKQEPEPESFPGGNLFVLQNEQSEQSFSPFSDDNTLFGNDSAVEQPSAFSVMPPPTAVETFIETMTSDRSAIIDPVDDIGPGGNDFETKFSDVIVEPAIQVPVSDFIVQGPAGQDAGMMPYDANAMNELSGFDY